MFILTPIWEKEKEVKYILNVMGAKISTYWFGTFIIDYLCFMIPFGFFVWGLFVFDVAFLQPYIWKMTFVVLVIIIFLNSNYLINKIIICILDFWCIDAGI